MQSLHLVGRLFSGPRWGKPQVEPHHEQRQYGLADHSITKPSWAALITASSAYPLRAFREWRRHEILQYERKSRGDERFPYSKGHQLSQLGRLFRGSTIGGRRPQFHSI